VELFHDYIRDGRIKLKEKLKEPTTVQDPCNVVRNGGLAEKNRRLAEFLSEDFRPMKLQVDQIRDLAKEYELDIKAVHFKEIISEHMVIPEEMIPKDDEEEAIEPASSE